MRVQSVVYNSVFTSVEIIDELIKNAIELNASDIHFEPLEKSMKIRYRIDGILYESGCIEQELVFQVIARIKVLAVLDVAEKRIPQDGKFSFSHKKQFIDIRVATFPTLYGEKVVLRILDRSYNFLQLDRLGFNTLIRDHFKKLMSRLNGFFIVTGPTGSGKTTTLYAVLAELVHSAKNIITLEDPIEYTIEGITQGQITVEAGFTFERGMRALLRQDPDIIMVGEIRDRETAVTALQAALTGHLVLSTLHTTNAASGLIRLIDMGIQPFLLNGALAGILAQRLARKLCINCRRSALLSDEDKIVLSDLQLAITQHYISEGCQLCHELGHKGRIGIFELLVMTPEMRLLLMSCSTTDQLTAQAKRDGMIPLLDSAVEYVNNGIISLAEFKTLFL